MSKMSGGLRIIALGFFLLPFENTFLAPSSGWPAVSPVIFAVYFILYGLSNIRWMHLIWMLLLIVISLIGYFFSLVFYDGFNRYFVRDVLGAVPSVMLGFSFLVSLLRVSYWGGKFRYEEFSYCLRMFLAGSITALLFSLFILVAGHMMQNELTLTLLDFLLKRNRDVERFSFVFAEPSFVSVHLLGVIVPLWVMAKLLGLEKEARRLICLLLVYICLSLLFVSSARLYLDILYLGGVWLLFKGQTVRCADSRAVAGSALAVILGCMLFNVFIAHPEIVDLLTLGRVNMTNDFRAIISSDASLESRFFRVEAVWEGLRNNPAVLFFGAGFGNAGQLVDSGFSVAFQNFRSGFTKEVYEIAAKGSGSNIYNMYLKVVAEFGVVLLIVAVIKLYSRKSIFLFFVLAWVYLQFDSYAFYGLWIYLVVKNIIAAQTDSTKGLDEEGRNENSSCCGTV